MTRPRLVRRLTHYLYARTLEPIILLQFMYYYVDFFSLGLRGSTTYLIVRGSTATARRNSNLVRIAARSPTERVLSNISSFTTHYVIPLGTTVAQICLKRVRTQPAATPLRSRPVATSLAVGWGECPLSLGLRSLATWLAARLRWAKSGPCGIETRKCMQHSCVR